jgi:hypothetical protein
VIPQITEFIDEGRRNLVTDITSSKMILKIDLKIGTRSKNEVWKDVLTMDSVL